MRAKRPDSDIRDDVLRELAWDSRIADKQIGVQVSEAVVTLGGIVNSLAMRNAAAEAAHQVAGVMDVANELEVVPGDSAHTSDTEIAKAIRHRLEWDALVPDKNIHSTVEAGVVLLDGAVLSQMERVEAELVVSHLRGVRRVENRLRIRPRLESEAIRGAIEAALERRALHESGRLRVGVRDGKVTVEGTVQSAEAHRAVLGAIRGTAGVQEIDDRVSVAERGGTV